MCGLKSVRMPAKISLPTISFLPIAHPRLISEVQTLLQHLLTTHILGRAHWNELMAELNIPWVDMIELAEARQKKLLEMQELERKEREKMETEMLNQERELLMKKMD